MEKKDISFQLEDTTFHYIVACFIIQNHRVLVMREDLSETYDYFPGGRVKIGENATTAICRELYEELSIQDAQVSLKAVLENFFQLREKPYQEICLVYCLTNQPNLPSQDFSQLDSDGHLHYYSWIDLDDLDHHNVYPAVIKEKIRLLEKTDQILYLLQKD